MAKALEVAVRTKAIPLSNPSAGIFSRLDRYDWILFTSKNAVKFFSQALKHQKAARPTKAKIAAVGPVTAKALRDAGFRVAIISKTPAVENLITELGNVHGKRILFPRSTIAPHDPIRKLRKRGAYVTALPLYTTSIRALSKTSRAGLLRGAYTQISFKSPSGVQGLLKQFNPTERRLVRTIPAICIGKTTAQSARAEGFKKILIQA